MELCYWRQRETRGDNGRHEKWETMREHKLWNYVIADNGRQRETTGDTGDHASTYIMVSWYEKEQGIGDDDGRHMKQETM